MTRIISTLAVALCFLIPGAAHADDEPLYEAFASYFKTEAFSLGAVVQLVGDFKPQRGEDGKNGITVANARLKVSGKLDYGFHYKVQADLDSELSVLDALVGWRPLPEFGVRAGMFRAAFSGEQTTSSTRNDFVKRSRFTDLAPDRQVGIQVEGTLIEEHVRYAAGMFNGTGRSLENDDSDFLWTGRLEFHWPFADQADGDPDGIVVAGNVAWSDDTSTGWYQFDDPEWSGERLVYGGDFRLEVINILLSGELVAARLSPDESALPDVEKSHPVGHHLTAGYRLPVPVQALFRWEAFSPDGFSQLDHRLLLGLNWWPTTPVRIQANYLYSLDDSRFRAEGQQHQVLVELQVAL